MNLVTYTRVSTKRQLQSGLGLEAQQHAITTYATLNSSKVLHSYTEAESGKNCNRPELTKAIEMCRLTNSVLLVAKIDRLTRDLGFLCKLRDSGIRFVACDNPQANELTINILAAVAQDERERIALRTKQGLAAARARGTKLGGHRVNSHQFSKQDLELSAATNKNRADEFVLRLQHEVSLEDSPEQIAHVLNSKHILTRQNKQWNRFSTTRLLNRLKLLTDGL